MSLRDVGMVKWFDVQKGYGFINNVLSDEDIFVHFSALDGSTGFRVLYDGEYVSFDKETLDNGKVVASTVTGVGGGPLLCQHPGRHINIVRKSKPNNHAKA